MSINAKCQRHNLFDVVILQYQHPQKKENGINGRMWCRRGGASLMCFCAQGGPTSLEPLQELGQLGFYHTSYTSGRLQANLFREGGHKYRKGV